ncbi:hypothetical protein V8Z74_14875 [Comamonas sp. w2-DMI]|uniref:hypothetical protein n=1 Tax=Comamonas sp. w2-DMI TaxID=3126391 RepID=UPI0032E4C473
MANPKFLDPIRVPCTLPIDPKKARKEITSRLKGCKEKKDIDPSKLNLNDSEALSQFLFKD